MDPVQQSLSCKVFELDSFQVRKFSLSLSLSLPPPPSLLPVSLPLSVQDHSGGDSVALGIVSLFPLLPVMAVPARTSTETTRRSATLIAVFNKSVRFQIAHSRGLYPAAVTMTLRNRFLGDLRLHADRLHVRAFQRRHTCVKSGGFFRRHLVSAWVKCNQCIDTWQ